MANPKQAVKRKSAQSSGLRTNIADFVRNPIQSSISWFDRYFLNQTPLFYRLAMLIVFMLGCGLVMVLSASNVVSIKATGDAFAEFRSQTYAAILGLVFMIFMRDLFLLASLPKLISLKKLKVPVEYLGKLATFVLLTAFSLIMLGTVINNTFVYEFAFAGVIWGGLLYWAAGLNYFKTIRDLKL